MRATIYDLDNNGNRSQPWPQTFEISDEANDDDLNRFYAEVGDLLEQATGSYEPGEHDVEVVIRDDEGETVRVETVTRTVA